MDSKTHSTPDARRRFLQRLGAWAGISAAVPAAGRAQSGASVTYTGGEANFLPKYALAQKYKSLKQSSYDRTGGNADRFVVKAGDTQEVFNATGPGVITHIWFTIAANSVAHLKEIVLRMYWDGNPKPSVEVPVGDFFGLNLGQYQIFESAFVACSPGKSLNCYFAMPFRRSARITVTNEGTQQVGAFYSNIDYQLVPSLPADAMYFHAQYRQNAPEVAITGENPKVNLDGKHNHVFMETRGRGHLMGVTLGVLQNTDNWMGEGDDMIFVDDETKPVINGTGLEDYFLGSWDFGGRDGAIPFAHHFYGAPLIVAPERAGGRYCCYRWHGDNPVTFTKYLKHTIEHGHADDRADNYYSVGYWYQSEPFTDFPAMPAVADRVPRLHIPA
ncbi:MAG TPA: glycoside hydrolase family 172 protein [Bryobacteraceae bacterium]|nr:glycoside hydrolase family 172 protein [Bryobacteraceae bacterium]